MLADNISRIRMQIEAACARAQRNVDEVEVIGVTKTVSSDIVYALVQNGIHHIAENKVQELNKKYLELSGKVPYWHLIGHLQTNKVKDVIGKINFLHSLDRLALAEALVKRAKGIEELPQCFIQVNISGEESKYGIPPEELIPFAEQIAQLNGIRVTGLMTMAPFYDDPEWTRPIFRRLRELRQQLNALKIPAIQPIHLSMGMSNDFEVAIEEGATLIRLGTSLVGSRV